MIVEMIGTSEQTERFWTLHDQLADRFLSSVQGPVVWANDPMNAARFGTFESAESFSKFNLGQQYPTVPVRVAYTQIVRVWHKEDISADE